MSSPFKEMDSFLFFLINAIIKKNKKCGEIMENIKETITVYADENDKGKRIDSF